MYYEFMEERIHMAKVPFCHVSILQKTGTL